MAKYDYLIIDQKGKEKKGSMEGPNVEKVTAALKAEGFIPLFVKEQTLLNKDIKINIGNGIKTRDISVFCRQFTGILAAGVTVINALQMLGEETENKVMKKAIKEVQASVEKGETLASSMSLQNSIFPSILINMVEAGEASGSLETAFSRMAEHFEKETKLKNLVTQAMIYPIIICIVALGAISIMMIVVVPNFISMFDEIDTKLPAITLFVVGISNFMVEKWWLLLIIILIAAVGIISFKKSPTGGDFFGQLALKIPLFGTLTIKASSARLMRTLSTLLTAGIPLVDAVDIAARTMDNAIIKKCLLDAKDEIVRGVPLSKPLEYSGIFPPMVYHMTKIGEETGNMEDMLDKVADYFDEEVEIATKALTSILEPMMIVIMALIVGVIIMAIMSPMLSLYSSIENS